MHVRFFAIWYISLPIVCKSNEKLNGFLKSLNQGIHFDITKARESLVRQPDWSNFFLILICVILAALNLKIAEGGFYENVLVRCDVSLRYKVRRQISVVFKHLFLSKIALQLKRKLFYQNAWNPDSPHQDGTLLSNHYRGEKSLRHVAMVANFLDLNKPWSNKYHRKKNEKKKDMYPFPAHHCTEEQTGSPFSSIVRECKWPSLLRTRNFANMVTWGHTSFY